MLITASTQISHRLLCRGCELMFKLSIKINCHSWGERQQQSEAGDNKLKIHKSSQHLHRVSIQSPHSLHCVQPPYSGWSGHQAPGGPGRQCGQLWYSENLDFCLLTALLTSREYAGDDAACVLLLGQYTAPALAMLWKLIVCTKIHIKS